MQHRTLIIRFGLLFSIVLICSCQSHNTPEPENQGKYCLPDSFLKHITFDTLRLRQVKSELSLSGKIISHEDRVTDLFPLVSGHVSEVMVTLGDYVQKGKVLAKLESSDMADYFDQYRSAQAELEIAKKSMEVTGSLNNSGITSEKDYLVARNEYLKALSQYNKVKEILKINGNTLEANDSTGSGYVIKSPISGFVITKNVNTGMDIRPDANNSLFTIGDLKEVWASANVYESDIAKIKKLSEAEVSTISYPDTIFRGKVEKISEVLDPETKLINVKIGLDNTGFKLKPGMFARIKLLFPEEKKMLAINTTSVIFDQNKSYLLIFRNKCDVTIRQVEIYESTGGISYISGESLQDGDIAIAKDGLFVYTVIKNQ